MDPIEAAKELSFRVGFSGHSGHLRLEPLCTVERSDPVKSLPDFVLVSVLILPIQLQFHCLSFMSSLQIAFGR
jgi:hypothetical protein